MPNRRDTLADDMFRSRQNNDHFASDETLSIRSNNSDTMLNSASRRISAALTSLMSKKRLWSVYENFVEWSIITTIHGMFYAFEKGINKASHYFWVLTGVVMLVLSIYLIAESYIDWSENPVSITLSTAALPVEEVSFPAITICGLGTVRERVQTAYFNQVMEHLSKKGISVDIDEATTVDELLDKFGHDFIHDNYPGATISPVQMVEMMTARDPTELIQAQTLANGYDGCEEKAFRAITESDGKQSNFCNNLLHDAATNVCYEYSSKTLKYDVATQMCLKKLGQMVDLSSDGQLYGIIKLIEKGLLTVLNGGSKIWVDLKKNSDGNYKLPNGEILTNTSLYYLNLKHQETNTTDEDCFVIHYSEDLRQFIGQPAPCNNRFASLCFHLYHEKPSCGESAKESIDINDEVNLVDRLLNPKTRVELIKATAQKRIDIFKAFQSIDITAAYASFFELLWNSHLPCFETKGLFAPVKQRSLLKKCQWKGIDIPCAAIFKSVPTDRGMCCAFNIKAADKIFYKSRYERMVTLLQKKEKENSLGNSEVPEWYLNASEPIAQQGVHKGLSITLDAHSELIGASTVSEDFRGFIAIVDSRDNYAFTQKESILIKTGHETLVAMSATDVKADLRGMAVDDRKCYFPTGKIEDDLLKIHDNYTRAGCILECQINFALDRMVQLGYEQCMPWYLPSLDTVPKMCNPWSAVVFREQIDLIPDEICTHCLTDCESATYSQFVTSAPFRRCDVKNPGLMELCSLKDSSFVDPRNEDVKVNSTIGNFSKPIGNKSVFKKNIKVKSREKDIAVVHFYFETDTVFQFRQKPNKSLTEFLTEVGGILGFCLGFSLSMGIEVVYWIAFRVWHEVHID